MRASLFGVAAAVALAVTAAGPNRAEAQVVLSFGNPYPYYGGFYPSYSYQYGYNFPGYRSYSYGWSNPYSTWNWSNYRTYPAYGGYYGNSWNGYRNNWGWNRGFRRW